MIRAPAALPVIDTVKARPLSGSAPVIIAVDGKSGSGKTALSSILAIELDAAIIPGDDFYAADVPDAVWDACTPAERADRAIDWRRLRRDALEPLLLRWTACWLAFDFEGGAHPDGTFAMQSAPKSQDPKSVIILDGAYSSRPELSDLLLFSVLVEAPVEVRQARLSAREDPEFLAQWHKRWDAAEEHYFTNVRPPSAFGFIITNG